MIRIFCIIGTLASNFNQFLPKKRPLKQCKYLCAPVINIYNRYNTVIICRMEAGEQHVIQQKCLMKSETKVILLIQYKILLKLRKTIWHRPYSSSQFQTIFEKLSHMITIWVKKKWMTPISVFGFPYYLQDDYGPREIIPICLWEIS